MSTPKKKVAPKSSKKKSTSPTSGKVLKELKEAVITLDIKNNVIEDLTERNERINESFAQVTGKLNGITQELSVLRNKLTKAEEIIEIRNKAYMDLNEKATAFENNTEANRKELETTLTKLYSTEELLESRNKAYIALSEQEKQLTDNLEQCKRELTTLGQKLSSTEIVLETRNQAYIALNEKATQLESALAICKQELQIHGEKLNNATASLESRNQELIALIAKYTGAERDLAVCKQELALKTEKLNEADHLVLSQKHELVILTEKIKSTNTTNLNQGKEIQDLKKHIKGLELALSNQKEKIFDIKLKTANERADNLVKLHNKELELIHDYFEKYKSGQDTLRDTLQFSFHRFFELLNNPIELKRVVNDIPRDATPINKTQADDSTESSPEIQTIFADKISALSTHEEQIIELSKEIDKLNESKHFIEEEVIQKNNEIQAFRKEIDYLYHNKWDNEQSLKNKEVSIQTLQGENTLLLEEANEKERAFRRVSLEKNKYEKELLWYKSTFENRKLLGIIKDRIFNKKTLLKKKRRKKYDFDNILCAIVNYNCNDNAKKLRDAFSPFLNTIVVDSGSPVKDKSFICLDNVYYSGLFNYVYNYAKENEFPFVFFICSDVVIEADQAKNIMKNLKSLDFYSLGIYSPASTGRSHFQCKKDAPDGIRVVSFVEGFIFLASMDVLSNIAPIDSNVNLLGWGIDTVSGYYCKALSKLCLVDDGAQVYHPAETGYSGDKADIQMENWVKSFHDIELEKFHNRQINLIRKGLNNKHKVSIIVPCYNQAAFLPETINSLFDQDFCTYEIIIVNDGSTDNTHQVATELAQKYNQIKYINQNNQGLGAARNAGIRASTGTYIQFLDSDDLLSPEKLSSQITDFLEDPSLDVSYTNYICFDDDEKDKRWVYSRVVMKDDAALDLIQHWETELSIPVHCFLFKKSSVDGIFFDESLPNHEDWNYHLRVAARKLKYKHSVTGTAIYRVRKKSMSRDNELMTQGKRMALESVVNLKLYNDYVYLEALKQRILE